MRAADNGSAPVSAMATGEQGAERKTGTNSAERGNWAARLLPILRSIQRDA